MADKIEELIMLARLGDEDALTTILTSYKPLVSSIARKFDIPGEDIDDIIQEGSIGLYKAVLTFDSTKNDNFSSYAALLIKRQILNALDASASKKNANLNNSVSIDDTIIDISSIPDPEEHLLKSYEFEDINSRIKDTLSAFEYSVYRLYVDGYAYTDIANILGAPVKKVDNALTRIKLKIKDILGGKK